MQANHGRAVDAVRERMARSEFHRWAGMELLDARPGEVDVALDVQPHHLNLVGILHGGMIATLADTVTGLAVRTMLEPGQDHVTGQLDLHFLSPARPGRILGRGRVVKMGRQMSYAEADIVDERDRLIARSGATLIMLRERSRRAPPKPMKGRSPQ